MTYTKIRVDYKYAPKGRLYRLLLIKGNPDLERLAIIIGTSLGAEFEHPFWIVAKDKTEYALDSAVDMGFLPCLSLKKHHLDDLTDTFAFEYDSGDCWDFVCQIYKQPVDFDGDKEAIIIEGKGQGIWEDHSWLLQDYLAGRLSNDPIDPEDEDAPRPWNYEIKRYSDFDLPLDIDQLNEGLEKSIDENEANVSWHEIM